VSPRSSDRLPRTRPPPQGPATLATEAWQLAGGLHILVNNAGISHPQPVVDTDPQLWDEVTAVNLRAPALLASQVGRAMAQAGQGGAIVNIASTAGLRALADHYSYCATKAGLIMATKVLALELGPAGIRANVVCPTIVMTEMGQQVWGEREKAAPMLARIPTGRFADPDEVADAVVFLASPAAAMVNGVEFPIDGGFTIS
jgi:NAD(P)-dependent dehydrogenase (short-subunit alcohol dehydrogenase family)